MQSSQPVSNTSLRSPTPPLDSSIEDLDDLCMDQELEKLDDITYASKKPHFLDYDSIPPPGFEDDCISNVAVKGISQNMYSGEHIKVDKKYETDGEISDFELAATNMRKNHKKEKTTSEMCTSVSTYTSVQKSEPSFDKNTGARRKKHFLDENPVPPDYEDSEREHRSLDRNFERTKSFDIKFERKHSLDRERQKKIKEPSYTLARFLEHDISPVYRGTWPADRPNDAQGSGGHFSSMPPGELKHLGPKVECVYSLLSMLGCNDQLEISSKFLELSKSPETCATLRHSRCIPLIVQMIHSDADEKTKKRASMALHNVVNCHPDDKAGRREAKVLRHIEQIMEYCDTLKNLHSNGETIADDRDRHPLQAICSLMKISFDEEHRHAMCQLGALQVIASLVHYDHAVHGHNSVDERCILLRRYAGMALTNLTFGDGNNKALLCTNKEFMKALVAQLNSTADDLLQVTASVLRNLSWRADNNMKKVLNEIGTVTALSHAVMKNKNENTLKALLSALWNLSAHCSTNKAEFCAVDGALAFLVDMLVFEGPSNTLHIIENAGGILRNVSSHIAVKEDYRQILRRRNCLGILLQQLSSESLTVVSNACGTLWNLSARCPEDQKYLLDNKAVSMLSLLIHSKHKMISNGSSAALKNLLNFRPGGVNHNNLDPIAKSMKLKELPSLNVRKQRALEQELDHNLSETCENIEITTPPKEDKSIDDYINLEQSRHYQQTNSNIIRLTKSAVVSKSDSKDSIVSVKSDSADINNIKISSHKTGTAKIDSIENDLLAHKTLALETKPTTSNSLTDYKINNLDCTPENVDFLNKADTSKTIAPTPAPRRSLKKNNEVKYDDNTDTYQETDLDQITDFSLRYAENQNEGSDTEDVKQPNTDEYGNEILLIIEDSVKCYQTEGTPYVISNAASVSDLRATKIEPAEVKKTSKSGHITIENSGINTPEKPTKYCEEGTPGYFSIYDSFSSLEEEGDCLSAVASSSKVQVVSKVSSQILEETIIPQAQEATESGNITNPTTPGGSIVKSVTFVDFAQETPLMFSRHSSLDSISSAEPAIVDDRSSVVSDFSRLASGIISPSEIPDSPTQIIPHSPRRLPGALVSFSIAQSAPSGRSTTNRLRSVFEDDVNTFGVENTPAQFSCATSLSNLSLDDEPKIATDSLTKEIKLPNHIIDETEDIFCENQSCMPINNDVQNAESIENTDVLSVSDESDDDNMLIETCINIGMNRGARVQNNVNTITNTKKTNVNEHVLSDDSSNSSDIGSDSLMEQCIRDGIEKTTASKTTTNHAIILPSNVYKDNPIGMLRKGGIPSYMASSDEMCKFNVEDSPCSYSVLSGLSDITIGSSVAGLSKKNRSSLMDHPNTYSQSNAHQSSISTAGDDSLSSVSVESEDDGNILSQAIAAGSQAHPKSKPTTLSKTFYPTSKIPPSTQSAITLTKQIYLPTQSAVLQQSTHAVDTNDSLSSIDSSDSNDTNQASILEQCIRSGMHKDSKEKPINKPKSFIPENIKTSSSPKRSQLPTFKSPSQIERDRQKERERKDELLLMECINTGMSKGIRLDSQIKPPTRHVRQVLAPTDYTQRIANLNISEHSTPISKNVETTSAAVSDTIVVGAPYTAPDVEMESPDGTKELKRDQPLRFTTQTIKIGSNIIVNDEIEDLNVLHMSYGSLNLSSDGNALESSNEFPALKLSNIDYTDESHHESSFEMEISNEFLMEQTDEITSPKIDKHKDPDLMLKSVERLTQELVSTAEFLRTTTSTEEYNPTVFEKKSSSNSNNTWNEDTCPNDISFPSISMTVPMIASLNDDDATFSDINPFKSDAVCIHEEQTPTNESKNFVEQTHCKEIFMNITESYEQKIYFEQDQFNLASLDATLKLENENHPTSQPDSLDTESNTIVNEDVPNISFQVGGEVQQTFRDNMSNYISSGSFSFNSSMTNSTIIAMEANKLVTELLNMQTMSESSNSLDLDHIRPPSGMDCVSFSGFYDAPNSNQISRTRKKSLPLGLMARRALSHAAPSGSLESVNSSCILDNIKPPSLMDELLDSMISVASITSEVVDNSCSQSQINMTSQYESALSDVDDTTTLKSCFDLPDDSTADCSSIESTPKKVRNLKRTLTPRQKRQIVKDRYRTYTIAADIILNENIDDDELKDVNMENDICDDNEKNNIENETDTKKLTAKQRRQEDRARFQTQVLDATMIGMGSVSTDDGRRTPKQNRSENQERYRTQIINFQTNGLNHNAVESELPSNLNNIALNSDQFITDDSCDATSNFSYDDDEELSSIRALTNKFKYIREANIDINVPTTFTTNHFRDVFMKQTDGDLNSIDFEQNSETESCDQNHVLDDETYNVSPKVKPKIVKPNESDQNADKDCVVNNGGAAEVNKAVCGKKKAIYVSPYRKTTINSPPRSNIPPKNSSDTKKAVVSKLSARNQPVVAKTHVIINKVNLTNKINAAKLSGIAKPGFTVKRNTVAEKNLINKPNGVKLNVNVLNKVGDSKTKIVGKISTTGNKVQNTVTPQMPERQGTFVKEESGSTDIPVVQSTPSSPIKSKLPSKLPAGKSSIPTSPAKNSNFISKLKIPLQKSASTGAAAKATLKTQQQIPRTAVPSTVNDAQKRRTMGFYRSPSSPTVPQRSNSNVSIKSTAKREPFATQPPSRSNSNITQPKKDITSRIASLWKKTDDPINQGKTTSKLNNVGKPPSGSKLLRSATFENTPDKKSSVKPQIDAVKPKQSRGSIVNGNDINGGIVRRIKNIGKPDDASKRISRLGSFINVDET